MGAWPYRKPIRSGTRVPRVPKAGPSCAGGRQREGEAEAGSPAPPVVGVPPTRRLVTPWTPLEAPCSGHPCVAWPPLDRGRRRGPTRSDPASRTLVIGSPPDDLPFPQSVMTVPTTPFGTDRSVTLPSGLGQRRRGMRGNCRHRDSSSALRLVRKQRRPCHIHIPPHMSSMRYFANGRIDSRTRW